jgi:hypothetical protein
VVLVFRVAVISNVPPVVPDAGLIDNQLSAVVATLAVHPLDTLVSTDTSSLPPAASTLTTVLDGVTTGTAPAWVTVTVTDVALSADTVMLPWRPAVLVFAVAVIANVPPLVPDAGSIDSQLCAAVATAAVHPLDTLVVTVTSSLPPVAPMLTVVLDAVTTGVAPAWVTVIVTDGAPVAATVMVPWRLVVFVLAVAVISNVPPLVPDAGSIDSQLCAAVATAAVHPLDTLVVTDTSSLPPPAPRLTVVLDGVTTGAVPGWVTVIVTDVAPVAATVMVP